MRKPITITMGTLNSDYDYDCTIMEKSGVVAITITDYDCNRTDPCPVRSGPALKSGILYAVLFCSACCAMQSQCVLY